MSTTVELRNSERSTFTTCPQKWEWAYIDRLKAKTPSPALRFGSLIHGALEEFYIPGVKRGPKPAETFERLYKEELKSQYKMGFRDEDGTWHDAGELGVCMLEAYYERFGKDTRWRVLATEIPFRLPVTHEETGFTFEYVGVMDGVWLDRESGKRKDIWIVDHKTTRDDPSKKGDALILDEQTGSYWSYGVDYLLQQGILGSQNGLTGMMFNFLRKGKPDERPKNAVGQHLNKDGTVSKQQPPPLFHREPVFRDAYDSNMVRERIMTQARLMHYMRTGKFPIYKVPGVLHNPYCKWCDYRDMCEVHESGGDWESLKKKLYVKWEPYAQHEIEDGEKMA